MLAKCYPGIWWNRFINFVDYSRLRIEIKAHQLSWINWNTNRAWIRPRAPKSKLGLPRVTIELDKSLNQIFQGGLENIGYTSSNGPPWNCCKIRNQYLIGHMLGEQNGESTASQENTRIMKGFGFSIRAWRFLFDRRTLWAHSAASISNNIFRRANEAFSTHFTSHPHLSLLTLDEHKYHEKVNNKDGILAKQDENRKNIVHLESPTSVAKQKLRLDPKMNHSKGQTPSPLAQPLLEFERLVTNWRKVRWVNKMNLSFGLILIV